MIQKPAQFCQGALPRVWRRVCPPPPLSSRTSLVSPWGWVTATCAHRHPRAPLLHGSDHCKASLPFSYKGPIKEPGPTATPSPQDPRTPSPVNITDAALPQQRVQRALWQLLRLRSEGDQHELCLQVLRWPRKEASSP